jgi:nicotinamidase-related amidase
MTVTALDSRTALVLVDLQEGVAFAVGQEAVAGPVAHARRLAAEFRARELPVLMVRVAYSADHGERPVNRTGLPPRRPTSTTPPAGDLSALIAGLDARPSDILVTKRRMGGFHGTDLDLQLRSRGITGIVLGGVATSLAVEGTGRAAYDHGYNVTFAADAMADFTEAAHQHSLQVTFPYFGEIGDTAAIVGALT